MRHIMLKIAALSLILPLAAHADIITFGDGTGEAVLGYTEGDLTITSAGFDCINIRDWQTSISPFCIPGAGESGDGERELLIFDFFDPVVFSSVSGDVFDLLGFDIEDPSADSLFPFGSFGFFNVTASNGEVLDFISSDFGTHSFGNVFLGISWFSLQCASSDCQFTVDNIVYTPSVGVPEPGTLALLGIGLFGMGLARRRRKV